MDRLSRRALTRQELRTRLQEKGFQHSDILQVLEKLEAWGYLNDRELAVTFSKNRLRRYSRRRVQLDMRNRGLEKPLIEDALATTYSAQDELQQCLTLANQWWEQEAKRWEQQREKEMLKKPVSREMWIQQRIGRKLIQRGYPSDMVWNVLSQLHSISFEGE